MDLNTEIGNIKQLIVDKSYQNLLKKNSGYCVDGEDVSISFINNIYIILNEEIERPNLSVKNGELYFSDVKVVKSQFNSLNLKADCEEYDLEFCERCFDLESLLRKAKLLCKKC